MKLMIDTETLSTNQNGLILSIGACFFDNEKIHDEFYVNIDLNDTIGKFEIDADTIYWWLSQPAQAGSVLGKDKKSLYDALIHFLNFTGKYKVSEVWANSPSFDLVMIKNHFKSICLPYPLKFWIERDFRTFVALTGAERVSPHVAHDALEDAKAQAQTIINYYKAQ